MTFWIIYILVQISFLGIALARFNQIFFFQFFVASQPWWLTFLLSPFTIKKLPTALHYTPYLCQEHMVRRDSTMPQGGKLLA